MYTVSPDELETQAYGIETEDTDDTLKQPTPTANIKQQPVSSGNYLFVVFAQLIVIGPCKFKFNWMDNV